MKTINVSFEDKEYRELIRVKGKKSWKEFIMGLKEKKLRGKNV